MDFPLTMLGAQALRAVPYFPGRDWAISKVLDRRCADRTVTGKFGRGLKFCGNPAHERYIRQLALMRWARPALAPVLEAFLRPGSNFVDAGAMFGLYTLWAARIVGPEGRVHSFEPNPYSADHLERHVEINHFSDRVEISRVALGETAEEIELLRLSDAPGLTSRYLTDQKTAETVRVPQERLDVLLADRPVDLIKIDVEGMEYEVLQGAAGLLQRTPGPALVFESEPNSLGAADRKWSDVVGWLRERDYSVWSMSGRGVTLETGEGPPGSLNVVAARADEYESALELLSRSRFEAGQSI